MNCYLFSGNAPLYEQGYPDSVFTGWFVQDSQAWTDFGQTKFSLVAMSPGFCNAIYA
ncbi:unnamed protein product [Moneuplotes crassus]|uniref:Uncharacterized protein n=1 Tax=Euplotes crassus TaxID=5936 RepID=A0AAD2D4X8_EUPCR|nr:unnamed protein product [Moneuplotes crassus]